MWRLLNQLCTLYNIFNLSINITLNPFEITNNIDPSDRFLYEETFHSKRAKNQGKVNLPYLFIQLGSQLYQRLFEGTFTRNLNVHKWHEIETLSTDTP